MKTTMKGNTMTKETMTYEELTNKVDSLLAETNEKMTNLIEQYNEEHEDEHEIDTVDLDNKFDSLSDYIYDYSSS